MFINAAKHLILTLFLITLSACGNYSSDTPPDTPPDTSSDTPPSTSSNVTGYLGDGFIQGAYVCHDDNNNLSCLDDTFATSNSDGSFTLSNYDSTKALLAQVPIGAIDHGPFVNSSLTSKTFTKPVWYYLPANSSKVFISPLSTVIHALQIHNPSLSLVQAHNIIKAKLGEKENSSVDLMDNYLSGSTQNSKLHAIAEVLNLSMQNNIDVATNTFSNAEKHWYSSAKIINNLEVLTTNIPSDPSTFTAAALTSNTSFTAPGYNTQISNLLAFSSLIYVPTDICSDLQTGYHALEDFNLPVIGTNYQEHKKIYLDGSGVLQIKSRNYIGSAWTDDNEGTSTHNDYLNHIDEHIIDMSIVNSAGDMKAYYDIPFPATKVSCDGASALFNSNGFKYRLFSAGFQLPLLPISLYSAFGQESSQLLTSAAPSFQASDMAYLSAMVKVGDSYVIEESTPIDDDLFRIYQDIGAPTFGTPIANDGIVRDLLDNTLVIYTPNTSNFYHKISRFDATTVSIQKNDNTSVIYPLVNKSYYFETHNGYDYLIIKDYQALNEDLFIGRVNSRDALNMIHGIVYRSGSYGLLSHPGDMMDDMMLNKSAVDRLLLNNNYPINY